MPAEDRNLFLSFAFSCEAGSRLRERLSVICTPTTQLCAKHTLITPVTG